MRGRLHLQDSTSFSLVPAPWTLALLSIIYAHGKHLDQTPLASSCPLKILTQKPVLLMLQSSTQAVSETLCSALAMKQCHILASTLHSADTRYAGCLTEHRSLSRAKSSMTLLALLSWWCHTLLRSRWRHGSSRCWGPGCRTNWQHWTTRPKSCLILHPLMLLKL